ncbi:phospholipid/cholesterol/gamma-HCH transport system substrate-binding protein [Micromonospora kangleipakensis]|uniref:Phospholipid/cholesterol/gamma-HCH transport system substrate-binding protein n=1 Tax=Micromonospora kangleipakensis TaxID=1077942 RepID=A0A4Q8BD92_9ACTN|nr:MCE family protein [Micromonospora kangleipakensis]RZU75628.1 phospholipid/cholesterol/gamma-HCH transport system substrate-binding protein [Micromonospora kangleipakensis]
MRHRVLGIVFIAVLTAALTASVLQYRKAFTPVERVTLHADRAGLQLLDGADVKVRGVVVGDVRSVRSDGGGAVIGLALDPATTDRIPADVTARLLPKTLFGERYVELVPPPTSTAGPIRDGAVITQDRSRTAVELERVLDRALPLLQSIRPDQLAATLGAISTALEGRGDQLGANLTRLDAYLRQLNPELPTIAEDVRQLAVALDGYDAALPDLLALLRDVTVTAATVTDQRTQLAAFLADTTDTADTTRGFLDRHGDQLIRLGHVSRPVLELLATYAPEYPCLAHGLVALQPRVEEVFAGGRMHITLEVTRDGGPYERGRDEPVYAAHDGPDCRGLPDPKVPAPEVPVADGYDHGGTRTRSLLPVGTPAGPAAPAAGPAMGRAGTGEESALVKPLVGGLTGTPAAEVPDIAVLLWGPLLRGAVVNAR